MKPAEIDMSSMRTMGILECTYSQGRYNSVGDLVIGLISKSAGLDYGDDYELREVASYATDQLTLALKKTNYFTIIEDNKLKAINPNNITDINKVRKSLGIDAILAPNLSEASCQRQGFIKEKKITNSTNNRQVIVEEPWISQSCNLTISYRIIKTADNGLVASKTFNESRVDEVLESQISNLYEPTYLLQNLLDRIIPKISRQIAPYLITETRFLKVDKTYDPLMKRASALAESGNLIQARELFLNRWHATANPAAGYNAAIIYQVEGKLEKALELLSKIIITSNDSSIISEHRRVLKILEERKQVEKQLR